MSAEAVTPELLSKIPIFAALSNEELAQIIKSPDNSYEEYNAKQRIIREEEIGDCMYVVLDGTVEVSIRGGSNRDITIATLRRGDFFGEQSLLPHGSGRRNASVYALHPSKLFRIDKKHVQLNVGGVEESEDITVPAAVKKKKDDIRDMLGKLRLFKSLSEAELDNYHNWTEVITVGPGDFVIKENEAADSLFVIIDGHVEVFVLDEDGKITILAKLLPGEYFGEQGLMPGASGKRNAYARTDDKTRLLKVPKPYFKLVLKRDSTLALHLLKRGQAQTKQRVKAKP
ncbi:MAG: cyclic nucleotide-binding domain-containing protein [Gammaproteobacteria bacterium]